MYNLYAANEVQDGGTHFATLRTITSSSVSNAITQKLDGRGSPSDDTGTSSGEDRVIIWRGCSREIGILLPNDQRQHRTLHIQEDVMPYALC